MSNWSQDGWEGRGEIFSVVSWQRQQGSLNTRVCQDRGGSWKQSIKWTSSYLPAYLCSGTAPHISLLFSSRGANFTPSLQGWRYTRLCQWQHHSLCWRQGMTLRRGTVYNTSLWLLRGLQGLLLHQLLQSWYLVLYHVGIYPFDLSGLP